MQQQRTFVIFTWLLVAYEIACYLANDAYIPGLPELARDLAISQSLAQYTFTAWFIGAFSCQLFLGPLSDSYGRRPILLIGGIVFVFSALLCMFAPTIHVLLFARFIQGAAVFSMVVPGYAAVHESCDTKTAIRITARMRSVSVLAAAFGPLLGGVLLLFMNWRWVFGLLGIWAAIALYLLFFKMPETLAPEKRHKFQAKILAKQYLTLLKNTIFLINVLANGFIVAAIIAWQLVGPFLIINKFHYSTVHFGIFQGVIFICFVLGTQLTKRIVSDNNTQKLITIGLTTAFLGGLIALAFSIIFPHMLSGIIVSMMLIVFGAGMTSPILSRLAIDASDLPMGIRMGMFSTMTMAIAALSSVIIGIFYTGTIESLAIIFLGFSSLAITIMSTVKLRLCYYQRKISQ